MNQSDRTTVATPASAWNADHEHVILTLRTDAHHGLGAREADRRLKIFGPNKLREHPEKSLWIILIDQFKSLIIGLLGVAAIVALWFGETLEVWAIAGVIIINALIGFFTELRAVRSMEALFKLGKVITRVRRDGLICEINAASLVPGDLVVVEGGDVVTADLRIIESNKLQADESTLTGESLPVDKQTGVIPENTILAERTNMLYKGTSVTRGSGTGIVTATGMDTELGKISSLVQDTHDEKTPLEIQIDKLGHKLIIITITITALVTVTGIITGKNLYLMIETGIALAVAAIPEGLPIVATIALARGVRMMARKNALINRLSSVETLGATDTIFTDKTGTLTENRMTASHFVLPDRQIDVGEPPEEVFTANGAILKPEDDPDLKLVLETGVLCNNASLYDNGRHGTGDPLEVALLMAGLKAGITDQALSVNHPEKREMAFDPEIRMMATWNETGPGRFRIHVKGAPGAVLDASNHIMKNGIPRPFSNTDKSHWRQLNENMASQGFRMLALAVKDVDSTDGNPYHELALCGLVALLDPPRKEVKEAIHRCMRAGIRVIMLTGDQIQTARYIAAAVGLESDNDARIMHGKNLPSGEELRSCETGHSPVMSTSIFARISPDQKLDLIEHYQKEGHIVAMTGDGVNDAPALKKADIGIAMGLRGTQVAREAADMVLTDDAFSTIVTAIEQGRVIFNNIRAFIFYLMSCNVSEVLVVGLATLINIPLPVLPLQILFLNLVTDVFPALALGFSEGEPAIMSRHPRHPWEPILTGRHWRYIGFYGLIITIAVLGSLWIGLRVLDLPTGNAVTLSFLTLTLAQLWQVFNMRSKSSHMIRNTIVRNPYVWAALILSATLVFLVMYIPLFAHILNIHPPGFYGWLTVIGCSLLPLLVGQILIRARGRSTISDYKSASGVKTPQEEPDHKD